MKTVVGLFWYAGSSMPLHFMPGKCSKNWNSEILVSNKKSMKDSLTDVTKFAKGSNEIDSLCKIFYFPLVH